MKVPDDTHRCITKEEAVKFLRNELSDEENRDIREKTEICPFCKRQLIIHPG